MTGATSKCICGVQPPENDLTTIFVCYFLHVRSSVYAGIILPIGPIPISLFLFELEAED